ncbi:MAG: uridylate kinase [Actinoplanes sp.]
MDLLCHLAEAVGSVTVEHPTRVAVDGPPAAGKTTLLDPLGPNGDRRFGHAVYDRETDTALSPPLTTAPADAVLIFDGVFLMRPELIDRWDLRIFLSIEIENTVDRAVIRERRVSSRAEVERRWRERYIPSQEFYFAMDRPALRADIVVHNDDPERPAWETRTH